MKRKCFLLTGISCVLLLPVSSKAGFLDKMSQKLNDAAKAIDDAVTVKTEPANQQQENAEQPANENNQDEFKELTVEQLLENVRNTRKGVNPKQVRKWLQAALNKAKTDFYNSNTHDELKKAEDLLRDIDNLAWNYSCNDISEEARNYLGDYDKQRETIRENEKKAEKKAAFEKFKSEADKKNEDQLICNLLDYLGDRKHGQGNLQEELNYIRSLLLDKLNSPMARLILLGHLLAKEDYDQAKADELLKAILGEHTGEGALAFIEQLRERGNTGFKDDFGGTRVLYEKPNAITRGADYANGKILETVKDNPAFIFPRKDICASELPLYKSYKSGMNKRYVVEDGKLTPGRNGIMDNEKLGVVVSTANNYNNDSKAGLNSILGKKEALPPEVDFVFAHKNKEDATGVLVQVEIAIRSPDIVFKDIVEKYSKQLGIPAPKIEKKVSKRDKLKNDLRMVIGTITIYEASCVMKSKEQEVVIKGFDCDVAFNDEAKELINEGDRKIIVMKMKAAVDANAIHITVKDSKQFDAYHKLYLEVKKAEAEKEEQRKNESKKKQLDF